MEEAYDLARLVEVETIASWASLPELVLKVAIESTAPAGSIGAGRVRNAGRLWLGRLGPRLVKVGDTVLLSTGVQTDRVLGSLQAELALRHGPATTITLPGLGPSSARQAVMTGRRAAAAFRSWCRDHRIPPPADLEESVVKSAIMAERARCAELPSRGVRALVVGSQHNAVTRAVIAGAARTGASTFYLPHAPVADNPWYRDLPVHHALLRGPAEVDFYLGLGVPDRSCLHSVGQPGLSLPPRFIASSMEHVVYAASSRSESALRSDVELIAEAVRQPVEVCLHPRSVDVGHDVFPSSWRVHPPGPTVDVLRERGAFALIQHSSGVGLEAMRAGIEVIDLCPPGQRPNYPYLADPHVQLVSDSVQLTAALAAVPQRVGAATERVRFAESWTVAGDPTAAAASADVIDSARPAGDPEPMLLNGWSGFTPF